MQPTQRRMNLIQTQSSHTTYEEIAVVLHVFQCEGSGSSRHQVRPFRLSCSCCCGKIPCQSLQYYFMASSHALLSLACYRKHWPPSSTFSLPCSNIILKEIKNPFLGEWHWWMWEPPTLTSCVTSCHITADFYGTIDTKHHPSIDTENTKSTKRTSNEHSIASFDSLCLKCDVVREYLWLTQFSDFVPKLERARGSDVWERCEMRRA